MKTGKVNFMEPFLGVTLIITEVSYIERPFSKNFQNIIT